MLNVAFGLNHFYGLMVVNQVVRSVSNGCTLRYLRIGIGTKLHEKGIEYGFL